MDRYSRGADTKKKLYGNDHFSKIGSAGGKATTAKPKGLAALSPERRQEISAKGVEARRRKAER